MHRLGRVFISSQLQAAPSNSIKTISSPFHVITVVSMCVRALCAGNIVIKMHKIDPRNPARQFYFSIVVIGDKYSGTRAACCELRACTKPPEHCVGAMLIYCALSSARVQPQHRRPRRARPQAQHQRVAFRLHHQCAQSMVPPVSRCLERQRHR